MLDTNTLTFGGLTDHTFTLGLAATLDITWTITRALEGVCTEDITYAVQISSDSGSTWQDVSATSIATLGNFGPYAEGSTTASWHLEDDRVTYSSVDYDPLAGSYKYRVTATNTYYFAIFTPLESSMHTLTINIPCSLTSEALTDMTLTVYTGDSEQEVNIWSASPSHCVVEDFSLSYIESEGSTTASWSWDAKMEVVDGVSSSDGSTPVKLVRFLGSEFTDNSFAGSTWHQFRLLAKAKNPSITAD